MIYTQAKLDLTELQQNDVYPDLNCMICIGILEMYDSKDVIIYGQSLIELMQLSIQDTAILPAGYCVHHNYASNYGQSLIVVDLENNFSLLMKSKLLDTPDNASTFSTPFIINFSSD